MVELLPILGSLGGAGGLVIVIVYLLAHIRADRAAAVDRITAANDRADRAEERTELARQLQDAALDRARTAEDRAGRAEALLSALLPPPVLPDPTAPPALPQDAP